jgi:hypothetical protein
MRLRSFLGWLKGDGAEEQPPAGAPPPGPPDAGPPPPIDPARLESLREDLRRRAIRMEIGGFRPPEGPGGSWFGRVNLALPGEGWPMSDGVPLHALAQIDLTQLPFRPPHLDDVAMVTVFISDDLPSEAPNGKGWCLRAYPDLAALVPLEPVDTGSEIKPFPMRPEVIEEDYPAWEDVPDGLREELFEEYFDHFSTADGFKLGGWPRLVQHEISWGGPDIHPAAPEYVFQIDSTDKGCWAWGDSGVGYFGRGTRPGHTGEWTLSWQCY